MVPPATSSARRLSPVLALHVDNSPAHIGTSTATSTVSARSPCYQKAKESDSNRVQAMGVSVLYLDMLYLGRKHCLYSR